MMSLFRALGFLIFAGASSRCEEVDWVQKFPVASPSGRFGHSMVYDAARGEVVLYGGYAEPVLRGETWVWNGTNWVQKLSNNLPDGTGYYAVSRYGHAMAYDDARSQVVLFGGFREGFGLGRVNDTWVWDGTNWTQRFPSKKPSARDEHAMVYDPAGRQVVLFGGFAGTWAWGEGWVPLADTWVWDGINWTEKSPTNKPPARERHAMAYDAARGQVVLFGGLGARGPLNDTWTWDGTTWTQKSPANKPPAREGHAMAYDAARRQVLLFGGDDSRTPRLLNDTWVWDGSNWVQQFPANSPPARDSHAMAYDAARDQVMLFGGAPGVGWVADTWVWMPRTPPLGGVTVTASLRADPSSGSAPLNGVDFIAAVGGTATGPMNYTFYCNRSDTGTNITPGWAAKFDSVPDNPKAAMDACNYPSPGTYTAKVIVERGTAPAAEARTTITVSPPAVRRQVVVLNWDDDVPFRVDYLDTSLAGVAYRFANPLRSMPAARETPKAFRSKVLDRVRQVFSDWTQPAVTNLHITDILTPGATVVYFTSESSSPLGRVWAGHIRGDVDRFNRRPDDAAVIFLPKETAQYESLSWVLREIVGTIAHEIGHTLGLVHVNAGAEEVMVGDLKELPENPKFMNAVSVATDWWVRRLWDDWSRHTHNPVYHLKRYTDGVTHEALLRQDVRHGSWDMPDRDWTAWIIARLEFGASDSTLHNAPFLAGPSPPPGLSTTLPDRVLYAVHILAGTGDDTMALLARFNRIRLSELSGVEFTLDEGSYLQLFGSTSPGGKVDVVLATGTPYQQENLFIAPVPGRLPAYLQIHSESAPGYETAASVTVTASTPSGAPPTAPLPTISAVVHAASFAKGPLVPGMLFTIFGKNLGAEGTAGEEAAYTLGGARVHVCRYPARMLHNSGTQINALTPRMIAGRTDCEVTVTTPDGAGGRLASTPVTVPVAAASMALFMFQPRRPDGTPVPNVLLPIVTNASYQLIGPEDIGVPYLAGAKPGEVITLWGTGGGLTFPRVDDAENTPLTGAEIIAKPVVKIGGLYAKVLYAGLAPTYCGLYQFNVEVPPDSSSGNRPLWFGEDPTGPIYYVWVK